MADPTVAPPAAPAPAPAAPASTPSPGWKSSEALISFAVIFLGALYQSDLIVVTSQLGKMIALGLQVLTALGYQYHRTQLKIAHLEMFSEPANDNAAAPAPRAAQAGFAALAVLWLMMAVTIIFCACTWFTSEAKKAEHALIDCTVGEGAQLEAIAFAVAPAVATGTISWSTVGDASVNAGEKIGGCFLTRVMADVEKLATGSGGIKTSSAAGVVELARFREALKTTAKYHLESGDR